MRIVIAPDSFKESLTARAAAEAIAAGVRDAAPAAETVLVPMSDGGEGFVDAVASAWGAQRVEVRTVDALGQPIGMVYGLDGHRAVMDVASCAGLELIAPEDRDVLRSTTAGLGLALADAVSRGATEVLLGIGGSATNDGGSGMLRALGARLLDTQGREVEPLPLGLAGLASVDASALEERLGGLRLAVACDVTNPLTGPEGATAVFGPQKGVTPEMVPVLDGALAALARASGRAGLAERPGAGAAGGLGFALTAFLGAALEPGVDLVAEAVGLEDAIAGADLVLTGEGAVDAQTAHGKTPAGVAALAAAHDVPCAVLAGVVRPGAEVLLDRGATELIEITPEGQGLEEALRRGAENLRSAAAACVTRMIEGGTLSS